MRTLPAIKESALVHNEPGRMSRKRKQIITIWEAIQECYYAREFQMDNAVCSFERILIHSRNSFEIKKCLETQLNTMISE